MNKLALVIALILATPVSADIEYTIATGVEGGSYSRTGNAFISMVSGGTNLNTNGAVENVELLVSGKVQFGIVQLDTWAKHLSKHPESADKVEELGILYDECLHLAAPVDGISSDDGLQDKKKTVAIGKEGSGMWSTWAYMGELEPKFKRAVSSPKYGSRALGKLLASTAGLDAVAWMSREDINNSMLTKVRNNPKLQMIPVDDMDLNDNHPILKRPVYTFKKIVVDDSGVFSSKVKTICTNAVILASSDVPDTLLDKAADVMLSNLATLTK